MNSSLTITNRATYVDNDQANEPVVFFLGGIGDQILVWPALRALARFFGGRMSLAVAPGTGEGLWADVATSTRVTVGWDGTRFDASALGPRRTFISLTTWPQVAPMRALIAASGATRSIGFFPYYGERVVFDPDAHMLHKNFAVARHLSSTADLDTFAGPPVFAPEMDRQADLLLGEHLRSGRKLLVVHPETKPHKLWPAERWESVLRSFLHRQPTFDVLMPTAAPYPIDLGALEPRLIRACGLPLPLALSTLRHAHLFAGIDSCFLHAADAYRVPGLAVLGPTDESAWGFLRAPCHRHVRSRDGELATLPASAVLSALLSLAGEAERDATHRSPSHQ